MKLFERFDKAFLINLPERVDRLKAFKEEVERYDLGEFEIVEGIKVNEKIDGIPSGAIGLIKTNLRIFTELAGDSETILIMEDDCSFTDKVLNIDEYFEKLPSDWDMLYMGGNHGAHVGLHAPIPINDHVVRLHSTRTTHFVAIKKKLFNEIIDYLRNPSLVIDVFYTTLQKKYMVYSFTPAIAKQRKGYSNIEERDVDYDYLIK